MTLLPQTYSSRSPDPVAERFNGLSTDLIHEALKAGAVAQRACASNHPRTSGGYYFYSETVRVLRDKAARASWTAESDSNIEYVVAPGGLTRIWVLAGDSDTGISNGNPKSRHGRGSYGRHAIDQNQMVLDLPGLVEAEPAIDTAFVPSWALLHYFDKGLNEIRCEISLPVPVLEDGRVSAWRERIVLPAVKLGEVKIPERPTNAIVDVEIRRRAK
jgi:hypothetical protein